MNEPGKTRLGIQIEYNDRNGRGQSFIQNLREDISDEDLYYAGIAILRLMGTAGLRGFSVHKLVDRRIGQKSGLFTWKT